MSVESKLDFKALHANKNVIARNYWNDRLKEFKFGCYFNNLKKPRGVIKYTEYVLRASPKNDQGLKRIAKQDKAKHIVLLSALGILAYKYSIFEDISIFCPVYAESQAQDCVNNIVPIRMNSFSESSFPKFLNVVKKNVIHDFENSNYPIEKILNIEKEEFKGMPIYGMLLEELQCATVFEDLSLDILFSFSIKNTLTLKVKYNSDAYDEKFIQQMCKHYFNLLSGLFDHSEKKVSDIEIITEDEKSELLNQLNNTNVNYPRDKTIHQLFEEQVVISSNKIAVEFEGKKLTYKELSEKSDQVACLLSKNGVCRNEIVGLLMDRSLETVIGMLAILKAGCAYLPIDIDYPDERKKYIVKDSGCTLLLTMKEFLSDQDYHVPALFIEDLENVSDELTHIKSTNNPTDLCYIIYTSGTTGFPKGVMVEHRNVVRLFFNDKFQFDFSESDVWTMFHSPSFDFSVWEIYGALLFGGKLIIIPKITAKDTKAFLDILKEKRVTVLNQTPSAFYNLIQEDLRNPPAMLNLRCVIFGGEALIPGKLKTWRSAYPDVKLINMFGITETTVHVTYKEIDESDIENNISNIGKPIPTLSVYLFDKHQKLIPSGIIGEMFVGGEGVARGYLGNKELTDKKFIANPYNPDERLYRSGDLARILHSGDIEYIGRIDHQVQLKGFRIELGEIESQLLQHNSIDESIVIDKEKEDNKILVAYYTSKEEISVSELRNYLSGRLPDYMIPSYFVHLKDIPLTSNGKIDRKALPEPTMKVGDNYVAPRTELEKLMVETWSKVLGVGKIGVTDNFYALGGDSILAVRLIGTLNTLFPIKLSLVELFENETIRELANFIETSKFTDEPERYKTINDDLKQFCDDYLEQNIGKHDLIEIIYPMSDIEKGMCYVHLTNPDDVLYLEQNIHPILVEKFNFQIFERAMNLLVKKHPTLRTAYDLSQFAHIVYKNFDLKIAYHDLSAISKKEQEEEIQLKLKEGRLKHFDLAVAPLWRMNIYKIEEHYHLLALELHHAIMDGWSYVSFLTELINTYAGLLQDESYKPKALEATYKDYVIKELLQKQNKQTLNYWKNELDGHRKLDLNIRTRHKVYKTVNKDYPGNLVLKLESIAQNRLTSVKHLLFAAYLYALKMLTYENDIVVGLVCFSRPLKKDGDRVLGCFLNTVPFRIQIPKNLTWNEYLDLIDKKLRIIRKYDSLSLFEINQALGGNSLDGNPFFDTLFNFINFHAGKEAIHLNSVKNLNEDLELNNYIRGHTLFDVNLHVNEKGIKATFEYASSFIDDDTFTKFLQYFEAIILKFIESGDELANTQQILSRKEKETLLIQFNNNDLRLPKDKTVIDLFERQVEATPHNIAIICDRGKMTYRELNESSNQLAHYFRGKFNIKANDLIGVLLDRSDKLIISILAILKAGAAYVPIDPKYPENRINLLIKNSELHGIILDGEHEAKVNLKNVVSISKEAEIIAKESIANPVKIVKAEDLFYVIYTSGSSGTPKGVMVKQIAFTNLIYWYQKMLHLNELDSVLLIAPISFDLTQKNFFAPLICGARLCLSEKLHLDYPAIADTIETNDITVINVAPSAFYPLLQKVTNDSYRKLKSLKKVVLGGEQINIKLFTEWSKSEFYNAKIVNSYGPTESTDVVSFYEINNREFSDLERVPIGKPVENTKLYILDKDMHLLPLGVAGELCIGGIGLALGYLGNEELTNQKFIENSFLEGERIYKTGDLARWLPDGNIDFLGRIDNQVKIRGFRIELGEIEHQLLHHDRIKDSAVLVYEKGNDKYLTAYYVSVDESEIDVEKLRKFLSDNLPEYMVPVYYKQLAVIPLSPNGKLDRKALPDPEIEIATDYLAPSNELEERLVEIWSGILGLEKEKISLNRSFFALGGDSIKIVQLNSIIRETLKWNVSIPEMFRYSTISSLIAFIKHKNINPDQYQLDVKEEVSEMQNLLEILDTD